MTGPAACVGRLRGRRRAPWGNTIERLLDGIARSCQAPQQRCASERRASRKPRREAKGARNRGFPESSLLAIVTTSAPAPNKESEGDFSLAKVTGMASNGVGGVASAQHTPNRGYI